MEAESIRFIIEETEQILTLSKEVDETVLIDVATYIKDNLRKKYSTDEFHYKDFELKHYTLEEIVKFRVSPIYLTIPHRRSVHTYNKPDERKIRTVYTFANKNTLSIQKYDGPKKTEQIEMKMSTLRNINEGNSDRQYHNPSLSDQLNDLKIELGGNAEVAKPPSIVLTNPMTFVHKVDGDSDQNSPTFGGLEKKKDFLSAGNVEKRELPTVRQKVPLADGKSQSAFIKQNLDNKNPTGKKVEPQLYTLEDVKKHSTDKDAWIVINGKIYDVTKYLDYHPGGKEKLMLGVGKDGTALYNKYHPWVNANFLLEKYLVGFLKR
jgi:cytochrome-b5 reductase